MQHYIQKNSMLIITANKNQTLWQHAVKLWPQAKIIDWRDILEAFWRHDARLRLLHPIEQSFIWQQCVSKHSADTQSSIEALASRTEEAFWLAEHWGMNWRALTSSTQQNTQWFCTVAKTFIHYKKKHGCADEIEALEHAINLAQEKPHNALALLGAPKQIIFYGFLKCTPLQKKFIAVLKKSVTDVCLFQQQKSTTKILPTLHVFDTAEDELDAAIDWVFKCYQKNPNQRLVLVVPNLRACRNTIETKLIQKKLDSNCFDILSPIALSEYGLIQTGLALLKLSFTYLPELNQLASLLRSPYFVMMAENEHIRSALMNKLRALQLNQLSWDVIIHAAAPWPALQQWLMLCHDKRSNKKHVFSEWVLHWRSIWQALGFAHPSLLNQKELALYARFDLLLTCFESLLPWQKPVSAAQALQALTECAAKTFWRFNEKKSYAAITIANVLDALYLPADQIWLMHAVQNEIPFTLSVNPLLDKKIQHQYGIWALDRAQHDALSAECYETLRQVSNQLTISYSKEARGQIKNPAVFCQTLTETKYFVEKKKMESFVANTPSTHLNAWVRDSLPGGSFALKAQRLCPMQSFAKYRLNLSPLPEPVLGLTAVERGIVVHRALQYIWQQLVSQEHLLALSEEGVAQLLQRIIPLALKMITWSRRKLLPDTLLVLEQAYLMTLLTDWLRLEATRPPFKIFSLEQEIEVIFAGKTWHLRIDRIDALADGRLVLIDYKTGKTSSSSWQTDLFTEPQLPLYAVTHALQVDAILFAELSRHAVKMIGLSEKTLHLGQFGSLPATEHWAELKTDWRTHLTQLTNDFVQSEAALAPLAGDITCTQCRLQPFCRIFDTTQ